VLRKLAVETLVPLREALRRRAPLAPLANRVLERRADVQQAFARPGGGVDRLEFVRWLSHDGIVHHKLKPAWAAAWLAEVEDVGVLRALLAFYDGDAELQRLFPQAFVEEHDADAFLAWLETHAAARGFPASVARTRAAALRVAADASAMRAIYASRPDVQAAYPDALASPPRRASSAGCTTRAAESTGCRRTRCSGSSGGRCSTPACAPTRPGATRAEWRGSTRWRRPCSVAPAFLDWLRAEHLEVPAGLARLCAARPAQLRRRAAALPPRGRAGAGAGPARVRGSRTIRTRCFDVVRGARRALGVSVRLARGGAARAAADGAARGRDGRRLPAHGVGHGRAVPLDRARR
jgi:hypothetical protein